MINRKLAVLSTVMLIALFLHLAYVCFINEKLITITDVLLLGSTIICFIASASSVSGTNYRTTISLCITSAIALVFTQSNIESATVGLSGNIADFIVALLNNAHLDVKNTIPSNIYPSIETIKAYKLIISLQLSFVMITLLISNLNAKKVKVYKSRKRPRKVPLFLK